MSELFTEISDQQQELVAGGFRYLPGFNLTNDSDTIFTQKYQAAGATGGSQSGRYGSAAGGNVFGVNEKIYTTGDNHLNVNIPGFSH